MSLPACSRASGSNDVSRWYGQPLCYAKYEVTGAEVLSPSESEKVLTDVFRLSGQFVNLANDSARRGDEPPAIVGWSLNDLTLQVAYLMPCAKINETSSWLLDFIHGGTSQVKLPKGVRVRFSGTAPETRLTSEPLNI
jgi:hypothetical protein